MSTCNSILPFLWAYIDVMKRVDMQHRQLLCYNQCYDLDKNPLSFYIDRYHKNIYINIYIYIYISPNVEEVSILKNKDQTKEIPDTTKIIKSQRQPQNFKGMLTSSTFRKTQHKGLPIAIINDTK